MDRDEFEDRGRELERRLRDELREDYSFYRRAKSHGLQWLRISVLVLGSVLGADAVVTYNTFDDTSENTAINYEQSERIRSLEQQVASLELRRGAESDFSVFKLRTGICGCLKKDNSSLQSFINCPAKNFTCDQESREICEAQHPNYEC